MLKDHRNNVAGNTDYSKDSFPCKNQIVDGKEARNANQYLMVISCVMIIILSTAFVWNVSISLEESFLIWFNLQKYEVLIVITIILTQHPKK